jgi:hypothetical protein
MALDFDQFVERAARDAGRELGPSLLSYWFADAIWSVHRCDLDGYWLLTYHASGGTAGAVGGLDDAVGLPRGWIAGGGLKDGERVLSVEPYDEGCLLLQSSSAWMLRWSAAGPRRVLVGRGGEPGRCVLDLEVPETLAKGRGQQRLDIP